MYVFRSRKERDEIRWRMRPVLMYRARAGSEVAAGCSEDRCRSVTPSTTLDDEDAA